MKNPGFQKSAWLVLIIAAAAATAARAAEVASLGSGHWHSNTTWSSGAVPGAADNVTIAAGHTVTVAQASAVYAVSNLTVNGILAHLANNGVGDPHYGINLSIGGNLNIPAGGLIDALGKGYAAYKGPAPGGYPYGSSHGGWGFAGKSALTYGSIVAPTNLGSGGSGAGGGAVILRVAGGTTLNGTINADGKPKQANYSPAGAGGSVWLSTATLAGTGTVSVKGGDAYGGSYGAGGGRVAVDLSAGESVGGVNLIAWGSLGDNNGPPGTVYKEMASQAAGQGVLVIDNGGIVPGSGGCTLISSNMPETSIGTLVIQNKGLFAIQTNWSFTLLGDFTNTTQTASIGGTLILGGGGTSRVTSLAGTHFLNLTCTNAGKGIDFSAGSTNWVDGVLTLNGAPGNLIHLNPLTASRWRLNAAPVIHSVSYVDVRYSDASARATIEAYYSTDLGNNTNWVFSQGAPGETNRWTGASNTVWNLGTNWSLGRQPVSGDVVLIPPACPRYPVLDNNKNLNILDIQAGGALRLGGFNLGVTNRLGCAGVLAATGAETVSLLGDADFTGGTFSNAASTVFIAGSGPQVLRLGGNRFYQTTVANTAAPVTFADPVTATNLYNFGGTLVFSNLVTASVFSNQSGSIAFNGNVSAGKLFNGSGNLAFGGDLNAVEFRCRTKGVSMTFHNGSTYSVTNLYLNGAPGQPITLRSDSPGNAWNLRVTRVARPQYVDVQDSDASGGIAIQPVTSVDSGNNPNWNFGDPAWLTWVGGLNTDFGNKTNWSPQVAPGAGSRIVIDGFYTNAPRILSSVTVTQLWVGGYTTATLTVDAPLTVAGDAAVLAGGVLTHSANTTSEVYRLMLAVSNSLAVDPAGLLDATGKGYAAWNGPAPGGTAPAKYGASHGGLGYGPPLYVTYGSITSPTNLGSSGEYPGGGAIILRVTGRTTLDGVVRADGQPIAANYRVAGAGGSVWLTTALLAGSGTISAQGGMLNTTATGGGGGRVAVKLTAGEDFDKVAMLAYGNIDATYASAGTIYREAASQAPGRGTLVVDNGGVTVSGGSYTLISSNVTGTAVGTVLIQNRGQLVIASNQSLTVSGSWSNGASFTAQTNSLVAFSGPAAAVVWGSNTFSRLYIGDPGTKPLSFQAGRIQTVCGDLSIDRAALGSTAPGQWWYLSVTNNATQALIQWVTVQDSHAGTGATIVVTRGGSDLGHNVNWLFASNPGTVIMIR